MLFEKNYFIIVPYFLLRELNNCQVERLYIILYYDIIKLLLFQEMYSFS